MPLGGRTEIEVVNSIIQGDIGGAYFLTEPAFSQIDAGQMIISIENDSYQQSLNGNIYSTDALPNLLFNAASVKGGDDIISLKNTRIGGFVLLGEGSDIVNHIGVPNSAAGTVNGGDDLLSSDGFIDQYNLVNYQESIQTFEGYMRLVNFENFALTQNTVLDLGASYSSTPAAGYDITHEKYIIDASSTLKAHNSGSGSYTLYGSLINNGNITLSDGAVGDILTISKNMSGDGVFYFDAELKNEFTADNVVVEGNISNPNAYISVSNIALSDSPIFDTSRETLLIRAPNDSDKSDENFIFTPDKQISSSQPYIGRVEGSIYPWRIRTSGNNWVLTLAELNTDGGDGTDGGGTDGGGTDGGGTDGGGTDGGGTDSGGTGGDGTGGGSTGGGNGNGNGNNNILIPILPELPTYLNLPRLTEHLIRTNVNSLHMRLGELRNHNSQSSTARFAFDDDKASMWSKVKLGSSEVKGRESFTIEAEEYSFTVGLDKKFDLNKDWTSYMGILGGYAVSDAMVSGDNGKYLAFGEKTHTKLSSRFVGAYATFFHDKGSYLDLTAFYHDFDAKIDNGRFYSQDEGQAFVASAEIGHSFDLDDDWIIEPQFQTSFYWMKWKDFDDNTNNIDFPTYLSLATRLGLRVEKTLPTSVGEIKPWLYIGAEQLFTKNDNVYFSATAFSPKLDDKSYVLQTGITADITDNMAIYGNFSYGSNFDDYKSVEGEIALRLSW